MDPDATRPRRSLRGKLILLVVLSVSTAVALISAVSAGAEAERETGLEVNRLSATAAVLASLSSQATSTGDRTGAFMVLRSISQMQGLVYGRIEDRLGHVIVETGRGVRLSNDVQITSGDRRGLMDMLHALTGRSIEAAAPIYAAGRPVGRVLILGRANGALERLLDGLKLSLLSAVFAILAGTLVALRMQSGLTRPILALSRSMREVETGHDYETVVNVEADDEVGLLVSSFNRMINEVRLRDQRIAAHVQNLEAEVSARTEDLKHAKEAAEAANSSKSDFLATMSHEIRTPMNGIMVMAEMLAAGDLPARQRRFAEVIAKSGSSLMAIINDILDFSKIEAGKLDLESIPCDLTEIVDDVLSLFWERAASKGVDLAAFIDPSTPKLILGDPVRLRQILGNLVNNAIKFTHEGGVLVDVRITPMGEIRVTVIDSGVGIPKDKLTSVFGAFSQADQSTTRRFGGTGLGLAICKRLVSAMGGRFDLRSREGAGTSFAFLWAAEVLEGPAAAPKAPRPGLSVVLEHAGVATQSALMRYLTAAGYAPVTSSDLESSAEIALIVAGVDAAPALLTPERLAKAPLVLVTSYGDRAATHLRPAASLVQPIRRCDLFPLLRQLEAGEALHAAEPLETSVIQADLPQFAGLKVLVADDSEVNREVALEALARLGVLASCVNDGLAALEAVAAGSFDLLLMDGSMPEMDGYEAARAIRAKEAAHGGPRLAVVALTAHVVGSGAEAWRAAGMDAVLPKPFTLRALADVIGQFHTSTGTAPAPSAAPVSTEPAASEHGELMDPVVTADLAAMARAGRGAFVRKIFRLYRDNAPPCVQAVREAVLAGDAAGAMRHCHALKSMSLNIGARAVSTLAGVLETRAQGGRCPSEVDVGLLERALTQTFFALMLNDGDNAPPKAVTKEEVLLAELKKALDGEGLHLVYQPQFGRDRAFSQSVEALVRWRSEDGQLISPAEFVPIAERAGLISRLTDWVFNRAMVETRDFPNLKLACNASASEFSAPGFVARVRDHLEKTGFDPKRLEIEVTETAILQNDEEVLRTMRTLQGMGVAVALDDFGAGYSSLLHLRKFPFDTLKIDREFVIACTEDAQSAAIVHAVISVGRAMGMKVVAEGVETEAQFSFMRVAGAHKIQGFLLARPLPFQELTAFLDQGDERQAGAA